jgi:hypothetical protein
VRVAPVAALVALADVGDHRRRVLVLDPEGGDQRVLGLDGDACGKSMLIEGYFARLMHRSLYKMHQSALHGSAQTVVSSIGRTITRHTEPKVKLH